MRASPISVAVLALIAGVAIPSTTPTAAAPAEKRTPMVLAQGAAPTPLGPRQRPPRTRPRAPGGAGPSPRPAAPATPIPEGTGSLIPAPVEVAPLSEIDPESVGVLDDSQGGLGIDMWQGADRPLVAHLLSLLPHRAGSPVTYDLMRRLLLTRATAPKGKIDGPSLVARRVEALVAIGDVDGALKLYHVADPALVDEALARSAVEAMFFTNDNAGACKEVQGRAQSYADVYWLEASAYCEVLAGDSARAALVSELLEDRKTEVDPAFFAAMDALNGERGITLKSLADPLALYISMARAANLRLPDDVVASGRPAVLRAVALSPNADLSVRLDAAERAVLVGALKRSELTQIYNSVPFDEGSLKKPLSTAEASWGPRGRALLIRAAAANQVPNARAEVLQHALQLARDKGGLPAMRAASVPLLRSIKPTENLLWFAGDAGRVLYGAGLIGDAGRWYALARQQSGSDKDAAAAVTSLWPLAAIAGDADDNAGNTDQAFAQWWAAQARKPEDVARAARLLGLLDATGVPVGYGTWSVVLGDGRGGTGLHPSSAVLHMLAGAASAHRHGAAVALALIALGDGGSAANPLAVEAAVRGLKDAGFEKEARAIALRSAVAAGL